MPPALPPPSRHVETALPLPLRAAWRMVRHEGLEFSGYLAFSALLAMFPFLVVLAAVAELVAETDAARQLIDTALQLLPGEVADTVDPAISQILAGGNGNILTVGIPIAFVTATNGIEALRLVLDRAYRGPRPAVFWRRRLQGALLMLVALLAALILSIAIIVAPLVWDFIADYTDNRLIGGRAFDVARYAAATATLAVTLALLHRWLPARQPRLAAIWPGVAVTTVAALVIAQAYSVYLSTLANYSDTYGSLGGAIATLVYLYLNGIVFIYGAELNAVRAITQRRRGRHPPPAEAV